MIAKTIADYGAEAVSFYAKFYTDDWMIPENFMRSFIERRINQHKELSVVAEQSFWQTACDIGERKAIELAGYKGKWNGDADFTFYSGDTPVALVELKRFIDGDSASLMVSERDKLVRFASLTNLKVYVAAFVTDTEKQGDKDERIDQIKTALGGAAPTTSQLCTAKGGWKWQFAVWGPYPSNSSGVES